MSTSTTIGDMSNDALTTHRNFFDEYLDTTTLNTQETQPNRDTNKNTTTLTEEEAKEQLLHYIWSNVVGTGDAIVTPFGNRKITYADYTASGRALRFIEDYISTEVLPLYANTHTLSDTTGLQTTLFRQEAREIVKRSCRGSIDDTILFMGSGTTSCIDATVRILNIPTLVSTAHRENTPLPIVLIGPYEHHSNILPWKEAGAKIITIPEYNTLETTSTILKTGLDLDILEKHLIQAKEDNTPLIVGAFSACSNVTGVIQDTLAPTALLRKYGALSTWDFAACAPHHPIDMNPSNVEQYKKDIIYFSPHKLVGGVSTPGVMCIKKRLLQTSAPHRPGGGTVLFVTNEKHVYLSNFEEKEEGGTPEIVGAIRAGLAMQLRESVSPTLIHHRELYHTRTVLSRWKKHPNIHILGLQHHTKIEDLQRLDDRVGIISFVIRYTPDPSLLLHHNYVAALLNDLFGIQARAGCACAGPYVQSTMGITEKTSTKFLDCIYEKMELVRPGMVRLNISYFTPEFEMEFIIKAVEWVATHGWRLLPLYSYVVTSGEFKHSSRLKKTVARRWLGSISYNQGTMGYASQRIQLVSDFNTTLQYDESSNNSTNNTHSLNQYDVCFKNHAQYLAQYLYDANALLDNLDKFLPSSLPDQNASISERAKQMRWFPFPHEALVDNTNMKENRQHSNKNSLPNVNTATYASYLDYITTFKSYDSENIQLYSLQTLNTPSKWLQRLQDAIQPHAPYVPGTHEQRIQCLEQGTLMQTAQQSDQQVSQRSDDTSSPVLLSKTDQVQDMSDNPATEQKPISSTPHLHYGLQDPLSNIRKTEAIIPAVNVTGMKDNTNITTTTSSTALSIPTSSASTTKMDLLCQHCFHEHKVPEGETTTQARECLSCECVTFVPRVAASKKEIEKLTKKISSSVGQAIQTFNMIREGDRILVGVSGGKDSLTLIHILLHLQKKAPIRFHIGACTVDPQAPEYDPSILKKYFAALGVPYYYISQGIMEQAKKSLLNGNGKTNRNSICAFCSRMRRGILYSTARKYNYNVLALGQHLDDLSESFLMSAFYNGLLRTMKVNYTNAAADVRVIRPLCLLRESKAREYAKACSLPIVNENCPACFEAPKERQRMKLLLAHQETIHPTIYQTLLKTMMPLLKLDSAGASVAALLGLKSGGNDDDDDDDDETLAITKKKSVKSNDVDTQEGNNVVLKKLKTEKFDAKQDTTILIQNVEPESRQSMEEDVDAVYV